MKSPQILLTGSAGFIGSHVSEALLTAAALYGNPVTLPLVESSPGVTVLQLDIDAAKVDLITPYIEHSTAAAIEEVGIGHGIFTRNRSRQKICRCEWRK